MPNPLGKNGKKPGPPDDELRPILQDYVLRGFTSGQIAKKLLKHFNPDFYSLSEDLIKKRRKHWGLQSARRQKHTVETAGPYIESIRAIYPSVGYRRMKNLLRQQLGQFISAPIILQYMNEAHPDEVKARRAKRFVRKVFWTVGVNDVWSMDQHDKWRKFQLFLHVGIEPYSGLILWLKIWWTNRNPRLVCRWYCDTIKRLGYKMPLLTQSDPGTENYGIANAQTILRHRHDPSLAESLQHQFRGNKGNIKPEIAWRQLRYGWTPGFEAIIQQGVDAGLYDPDDVLERLTFHYVFIPWLQEELDKYVELVNDSKPRFDRHKILPRGRPIEIYNFPDEYCSKDFSIEVDPNHLEEVQAKYAPPIDPVFYLVPPSFSAHAEAFYGSAGPPRATCDTVWGIYQELLTHMLHLQQEPDIVTMVNEQAALPAVGEDAQGAEYMELLPLKKYRPCRNGDSAQEIVSEEEDIEHNYWTESASENDEDYP